MSHPSAVLELNGPQVLGVMKRPQVPLVQEAVRVVTTQLGSQGRFCLPYPEFAMRETGTHRLNLYRCSSKVPVFPGSVLCSLLNPYNFNITQTKSYLHGIQDSFLTPFELP